MGPNAVQILKSFPSFPALSTEEVKGRGERSGKDLFSQRVKADDLGSGCKRGIEKKLETLAGRERDLRSLMGFQCLLNLNYLGKVHNLQIP